MKRLKEVDPASIPKEMKESPTWVIWYYRQKSSNGKPSKVPLGKGDKPWNDVDSLMSFREAYHRDKKHLGFALIESGFVGIDIDNAFDESGKVKPCVSEIINMLPPTWGDISPSGKGFHLYLKGIKPEGMPCKFPLADGAAIEIYDENRYFTVTGEQVPNTPMSIAKENGCLLEIWEHLNDGNQPPKFSVRRFERTLIEAKCIEAFYQYLGSNSKISKLFSEGDISKYDDDWSRADLAICNKLAFFMQGDAELVDKMFRQSALYRHKWDEKRGQLTYGEMTIRKALEGLTEIYGGTENKSERVLQELMKCLVWIKDLEVFVDVHRPHQPLRRSSIRDSYRNRLKSADTKILDHPERLGADNLGFLPGRGRIVRTSKGMIFNQWKAPSIVPRKGSIDMFYEAMVHTYPCVTSAHMVPTSRFT